MNQSSTEYFLRKYSNRGSFSQSNFNRNGFSSLFETSPVVGRQWIQKEEESSKFNKKTKDLQRKSWKMQDQLDELQDIMKKVEGKNIYLTAQVEYYQNELRTLNQLMIQEQASLQEQVRKLKNQLDSIKDNANSSQKTENHLDLHFNENSHLRDTIQQMKIKENQLLEEISRLFKILDREKVDWLEKIVLKEKEFSEIVKDKDLEIFRLKKENEELRCKGIEQDFSIKVMKEDLEELKISAEDLKKHKKVKKSSKVCFSPRNSEKVISRSSQRLKNDLNESKSGSIYHKSCKNPNFSTTSSKDFGRTEIFLTNQEKNQEKALKDQVKKLEKQIGQVNRDYRRLIYSTTPGSEGYFKHKKEVDSLARALEEKSKSLFDVKRRYSSLIRSFSLSSDM
jgi:chromosome segregation ATPase